MSTSSAKKAEIGHVLFTDIVGYSRLPSDQQTQTIERLNEIVRASEAFRQASDVVRIPTGDGMALVFFNEPLAPAQCAFDVAQALQAEPTFCLRMGLHSGPVQRTTDINEKENIAGSGINMAQRVMNLGDAGHILASDTYAAILQEFGDWASRCHERYEAKVKHGVSVRVFNLYAEVGNSEVPAVLQSLPIDVNWIQSTLQLIGALLFRPSKWQATVQQVRPPLRADFSLFDLELAHFANPRVRQLLLDGCIICPILAGFVWWIGEWLINGSQQVVALGFPFKIHIATLFLSYLSMGVLVSALTGFAAGTVLFLFSLFTDLAIFLAWRLVGDPASVLVGSVLAGALAVVLSQTVLQPQRHSIVREAIGVIAGIAIALVTLVLGAVLLLFTAFISYKLFRLGHSLSMGISIGVTATAVCTISSALRTGRWLRSYVASVCVGFVAGTCGGLFGKVFSSGMDELVGSKRIEAVTPEMIDMMWKAFSDGIQQTPMAAGIFAGAAAAVCVSLVYGFSTAVSGVRAGAIATALLFYFIDVGSQSYLRHSNLWNLVPIVVAGLVLIYLRRRLFVFREQ